MDNQNQAMRSMFAMLRTHARASITTGREGTCFVTSTSKADKEQQVEAQSHTQKYPQNAEELAEGLLVSYGPLSCVNHDDITTTAK